MTKRLLLGLVAAVCAFSATACRDKQITEVKVTVIDSTKTGGTGGGSVQIVSTALGHSQLWIGGGNCGPSTTSVSVVTNPAGAGVTIISSNPGVVSVSGNTLTAVSAGTATIRVRVNATGQETTIGTITVVQCTTGGGGSISFSPNGGTYTQGTVITVTATCTGTLSCSAPAWYTDHPEIISITGNGPATTVNGVTYHTGTTATIRFIGIGSARLCVQPAINVTSPNFCATFTSNPGGQFSVSPGNLTQQGCAAITFVLRDASGNAVSGVTWSSTASGMNSSTGVFIPSTPGTFTIMASYNNTTYTATVTITGTCGSTGGTPVISPYSSITVTSCSGYQTTWPLTVTVNGQQTTGTWSSSNPGVATVSQSGVVTLTGSAGTATITVTTSGGSATIPVTVNTCNTTGTLQPTGITNLGSGQSCTNTSVVYTSDLPVQSWTASPTGIVTVTPIGSNQARVDVVSGQSGTVTITANLQGGGTRTATVQVSNVSCVQNGVTSVNVTPDQATIAIGAQQGFSAVVTTTGNVSTGVTWTLSHPTIAILANVNGNQVTVEGRAAGTVQLCATAQADNTKQDCSTITVTSFVSSIDYTPPGGTIAVGATQTLTATCSTPAGYACNPYWHSSDPSRVTVTGNGSPVVIGGVTYPAGTTATIRRIAAGTVSICVQAAVQDKTIQRCYNWQ